MEESKQQPVVSVANQNPKKVRARKVTPLGYVRANGPAAKNLADTNTSHTAEETPVSSSPVEFAVNPVTHQDSQTALQALPDSSICANDTPEPKRRLRFEERYDRVTLYLLKEVNRKVRQLYSSGDVDNLSELFNAAVNDYLTTHFGV